VAEDSFTLSTFIVSWQAYQSRLRDALAPLTADQLALRAAPGLRSVGEIAMHVVVCRVSWLTEFLGEDGGEELKPYAGWNEAARTLGASVPAAAELAEGLERSWRFTSDCLARWSPAEMRETFTDDWDGKQVELSRAWVVWHVLEHDLHHGGELSLTLGMHGLQVDLPS
jgi:uncharacterized damage-inducible protein DinB